MRRQDKIPFRKIISMVSLLNVVSDHVICPVNSNNESGFYEYEYLDETYDLYIHGCSVCDYLDRFILVLPTNAEQRRILWEYLYENHVTDYEHMIDTDHNLQCIQQMLDILQNKIHSSELNVLDFGCGTGLSVKAIFPGRIYGYDMNKNMREAASQKGMKVMEEKEFWTLPKEYFHGILASYAFHMAIRVQEIEKLVYILKKDGILVANYYKEMDCERINNMLTFFHMSIVERIEDRRFGQIYVYRK